MYKSVNLNELSLFDLEANNIILYSDPYQIEEINVDGKLKRGLRLRNFDTFQINNGIWVQYYEKELYECIQDRVDELGQLKWKHTGNKYTFDELNEMGKEYTANKKEANK